jgi:hypothetical protein
MSLQVINSTLLLAASLTSVLLVVDGGAYLIVSSLFDGERLVAGTSPASPTEAVRARNSRTRARRSGGRSSVSVGALRIPAPCSSR